MSNEIDFNIDYEKLRKKLVFREFLSSLIVDTHASFGNCVNASEATPEQLVSMAKRYNINLNKFKKK